MFGFFRKKKDPGLEELNRINETQSKEMLNCEDETYVNPIEHSGGFHMVVSDVFTITGRGTVVTGQIDKGSIKVGDRIYVISQSGSRKVKIIEGVEMFRRIVDKAVEGDKVGLIINGITKQEVLKGDVIEK